MKVFDGIIGQTFGRLTVIDRAPNNKRGWSVWNCRCACGNSKCVSANSLKSGNTSSCGCLRKELLVARSETHGMHGTPVYIVWCNMRNRCNNHKNHSYKNYGGRGIKVCKRWGSFEKFLTDMGERPEGKCIERIDNNGGYTPENCRWATARQQANNKRNNHLVTYNGATLTLAQWGRKTGIRDRTLYDRLKSGWSAHNALTIPVGEI